LNKTLRKYNEAFFIFKKSKNEEGISKRKQNIIIRLFYEAPFARFTRFFKWHPREEKNETDKE